MRQWTRSFSRGGRAGVTLLELLVAIAIVGLSSGMAVVAWNRQDRTQGSATDLLAHHLADARRQAVATGRRVHVQLRIPEEGVAHAVGDGTEGRVLELTALPDGSVVAPPESGIDRLGGFLHRAQADRAY